MVLFGTGPFGHHCKKVTWWQPHGCFVLPANMTSVCPHQQLSRHDLPSTQGSCLVVWEVVGGLLASNGGAQGRSKHCAMQDAQQNCPARPVSRAKAVGGLCVVSQCSPCYVRPLQWGTAGRFHINAHRILLSILHPAQRITLILQDRHL